MAGLLHIYCGEGKGKTTAAAGLALRAAGAGMRVLFVQFLKDGSSSEIKALEKFENISIEVCKKNYGFFKHMSDEERKEAAHAYCELFKNAVKKSENGVDMLILDEIISACSHKLISEAMLTDYIKRKPAGLELVLTGRYPSDALIDLSDYVTEMKKIKHPYDRGIAARRGVEF
ncbi:MAG: cob(I)yrinic acid a,c-diamide adenosyltransferase [Clostridia bacterium]|nr:cob(I)yrinic acid a,c-diamide adenosyltransferase [Clostridia bacterium]